MTRPSDGHCCVLMSAVVGVRRRPADLISGCLLGRYRGPVRQIPWWRSFRRRRWLCCGSGGAVDGYDGGYG